MNLTETLWQAIKGIVSLIKSKKSRPALGESAPQES